MSFKVPPQLLYMALLLLFSYCAYLQYEIIKLSDLIEGSASKSTTSSAVVPFRVRDLLVKKSPPPIPPRPTTSEEEKNIKRESYGGKGDPQHLGGFIAQDNETISHNLWRFMLSELAVKSIIDVGCGRGHSSKFFLDRGARVLCVEGSADAVRQSVLPSEVIVHHDFSLGPWWPDQTFDVAWSTEFVEHVGRQYMPNYLPIFKKSAFVMISTVGWGGWHHVEIHGPWWWISRMEAQGFIYATQLTEKCQHEVTQEMLKKERNIQKLDGILIFINPEVAMLPQHRHIIGGHGCEDFVIDNVNGGKPCQGVDALPEEYKSLIYCTREENSATKSLWQC